jgi:hypothetical protein
LSNFSKIFSTLIFLIPSCFSDAQSNYDSLKIAAQENYSANSIHSFIFGNHWRSIWTTPISIQYLDLNQYAGGLRPIKTGGGMQTKSLQLQAQNGKIYKFRSVDKFPGRSLPDDFKGSKVESFMQDQITTIHPYSSLIVSSLIQPTGILNSKSELYVMPESSMLNEYAAEFGNMLGTIEEKPDEYENSKLNFAGAYKIRDTYKTFDELQEDNDNYIVATDYLKARLFDIFIGDRDRHAGQWDWAEFRDGKKKVYKPIPKDRDFAFPLYDGLIPRALTIAITSYVHFDFDMPAMLDLTWEGRHLDRRILGVIDKTEWDSVANYLQSVLTDDVINCSIHSLPIEIQSITEFLLVPKLLSRRNQLKEASDEFYKLANQYVDIYLSDKDEYVEVTRVDNSFTFVEAFKRDKNTGAIKNDIVYKRKFDHTFTEEIRLHLNDGDDKAVIKGSSDNPILIVIDGGKGDDELVDSSKVNSSVSKTKFFDSGKNSEFIVSESTYINKKKYDEPDDKKQKYEPSQEDRFHDFGVLVPFSISSDYGVVLGIGGGFNFYDYKIIPYSYRLEALGSYAYFTEAFKFEANSYFNQLIDNWQLNFFGEVSQLEITRFNGLGNETIRTEELDNKKYYQVEQERYLLGSLFSHCFSKTFSFQIGSSFESSKIKTLDNTFLNDSTFYGVGNFSFLNLYAGITYDSRDNIGFPHNGYFFDFNICYSPKLLNNPTEFLKSRIDLRTYFESDFVTNNTISIKAVGEILKGDYPFFKGASLGGSKSLRGHPSNRFVGDALLFFQSEWRIFIDKPRIFIPGRFGIRLFAETGRVYLKDEESDLWHQSYGGGLYYDILDRLLTINFDIAASKDLVRYYLYFTKSF